MARAIDPFDVKFINTTKLLGGKYEGRSLCDVGSTVDGLVYLHGLTTMSKPPTFAGAAMLDLIGRFLDDPERAEALGQQKGKRGRGKRRRP